MPIGIYVVLLFTIFVFWGCSDGMEKQQQQTRHHYNPQTHPRKRPKHLPTLRDNNTAIRRGPHRQHPRLRLRRGLQTPTPLPNLPQHKDPTRGSSSTGQQTSTAQTPTAPTPGSGLLSWGQPEGVGGYPGGAGRARGGHTVKEAVRVRGFVPSGAFSTAIYPVAGVSALSSGFCVL